MTMIYYVYLIDLIYGNFIHVLNLNIFFGFDRIHFSLANDVYFAGIIKLLILVNVITRQKDAMQKDVFQMQKNAFQMQRVDVMSFTGFMIVEIHSECISTIIKQKYILNVFLLCFFNCNRIFIIFSI